MKKREEQKEHPQANRNYKANIFAMLYRDKKELLNLYNAVSGKHYEDPELLEINTLENAIYMSIRNDVSFLIDSRLPLYEHQSTYNPNLPLRYLFYTADLYSGITRNDNLYSTVLIKIPTPNFLIFYNGEDEMPDRVEMKLSDAYSVQEDSPDLELKAVMLNINPGHNKELLNNCKSLRDYAEYTSRVRRYADVMELSEAVERAITECIQEGILAEFLTKNRAEAKSMSIYEYDMEKHMRMEREENWERGRKAGKEEGKEEGRIEGNKEAILEYNHLVMKLSQNGELHLIAQAASNPELLEELFKRYKIN